LLEVLDDEQRCIRIFERRCDGSRLYYDSEALYTHVDAAGDNLLEYIAAIERVVRRCDSVLLLGTAGGALATALARRGAAVTAVDDWATAFEIARRWFHLPETVECVHADAVEFLRSTQRQWSAIVVDVFHRMEIPEAMLRRSTADLLRRATRSGGLVIWNVADASSSETVRWVASALRLAGLSPQPAPVLCPDVGNTLVICRNHDESRHA
jgi:predicted membrane-bound spermidine synthase